MIKCPTCKTADPKHTEGMIFWCRVCGSRIEVSAHSTQIVGLSVPTQAKSHERLRCVLTNARAFAVDAIEAAVDLKDFDPNDHVLVKEIDAALAIDKKETV